MTPEEHIAESRDSAQTAERLFEEGRPLQGAEIVWCSVKHAINAIGLQQGWLYDTYRQKKSIVKRLESEDQHNLLDLLAAARRLHIDSDHGILNTQEVKEYRDSAAVLTEQLLTIAAQSQ